MLINSFVLFFRLHGWNYLWLKAVKRRKGEIARDLAAVGHNILHFKLELRPKCWKSFLTVTAVDRWGVALSLPQIWASKLKIFLENQCWNHEYSFWIWLVPNSVTRGIHSMQAVSNLPISTWHPAVALSSWCRCTVGALSVRGSKSRDYMHYTGMILSL